MHTSILMFGEGTIAPLCHSSPASTQRQLEDLQGDLKRTPRTFLHQKLGDRRRAAASLCRVHELFPFISVPCYLSSQDCGPFIILTVMARSNSHCQRPKPVTSSNSISCTGTRQKLVRWLATSDYCHLGSSPLPGWPHWRKGQVSRSRQAHKSRIHNPLQNPTMPPEPVPPGWVLGLSRARHTDISVLQLQSQDST